MHPKNTTLSLLAAFILGTISVLGFAPYYLFPIPVFTLAALFYLFFKASTAKQTFQLGFAFGLGLYCLGIYWIYISLHDYGGMPWWFAGFSTFCLCAFMALFVGFVGFLSKKIGTPWLSTPILWGLSDWMRSWIFTGFPWLTLGYSQVPHSPLAGYMPIIGVYGVSVLTAFLAALMMAVTVYVLQKNKDALQAKKIQQAIVAITLLVVAGLILKSIEWTSPIGKPLAVALIQGNIAQNEKWSPETAQSTINTYIALAKQSQAQLIVLPETALPVISSQIDPSITNALTEHAIKNNGDIIVGMVEQKEVTGEFLNSAFSFGLAPSQRYAKNHLVPFGEFIPLKQVFGWIYRDWIKIPLSDLARGGSQQKPMTLANQKLAVNICYEDVFGEEIIHQLPEATMLVNISNVAWFGKSFSAYQHLQFSQARALETGRFMLRATNTGATAAIDTHGYVFAHAPHDVQTILNVQAQGYSGSTPYVRWGNWPFIVFIFGVLGFLVFKLLYAKKTEK